jgi:hypothetical protein
MVWCGVLLCCCSVCGVLWVAVVLLQRLWPYTFVVARCGARHRIQTSYTIFATLHLPEDIATLYLPATFPCGVSEGQ